MTDDTQALVQSWLEKSRHDLRSAKLLASDADPILDTALFHCQQAAEKAVKGFLTFRDIRFDKTHDVGHLIKLAMSVEPAFREWDEAGACLTPYAVAYRYPQDIAEPDSGEFREAFDAAVSFYRFVLSILPTTTHPASDFIP